MASDENERRNNAVEARRVALVGFTGSVASSTEAAATTAGKILTAGVQLFNQHGMQNVAMSRIAGEVGISPGNLAYHFKSKRDMLVAMLPTIERGMLEAIRVPPSESVSPSVVAQWQIGIFQYIWKFRFFFTSLTYVIPDDHALRRHYVLFERRIIDRVADLLDKVVERRLMRPVKQPNTTRLVATNMWLLWLAWLQCEQIRSPNIAVAETAAIYQGALRHFSLIQPYFGRDFCVRLLDSIRVALGTEADPAT